MAVTRQRFEVFRFPVMQSPFCFFNIALITIPAASLINYFRRKGVLCLGFIGLIAAPWKLDVLKTKLRKADRTVGVNCNIFSNISSGTA